MSHPRLYPTGAKPMTYVSAMRFRDGRFVVSAGAMSMDARTPKVKKAIKLTALALKTAG